MQRQGSSTGSLSLLASPPAASPRHLVGSYEECLLNGRMSLSAPKTSRGFMIDIAANGMGVTSPRATLPFDACFYDLHDGQAPTPYVGVIDLERGLKHHTHPGLYRVPGRGIVQAVIYNPERTGIKIFVVKYDFSDMPAGTHTFVRQRTHVQMAASGGSSTASSPSSTSSARALRYLIHLRFICPRKGRVYLHRQIQVVFAHRLPDESETLRVEIDGPDSPKYIPLPTHRSMAAAITSPPTATPPAARGLRSSRSQLSFSESLPPDE